MDVSTFERLSDSPSGYTVEIDAQHETNRYIGDIDLGFIYNGQKIEHKSVASKDQEYHWIDHYFSVNQPVYAWFDLSEFSDDLDLYLWEFDENWDPASAKTINSSQFSGIDEEGFFKYLDPGNYCVDVTTYESLNEYDSGYLLEIDTAKFLENAIIPNDSRFNEQWHLFNTGQGFGLDNYDILAPEAWALQSSSEDIVVAVIDTGIDYNHVDLDDNIWYNIDEIPGNGIDDDRNGYVDDYQGWDFYNSDNDPHPKSNENVHGTHVAGIIGAEGNNGIGVAGVTWDVQLMNLKVFPDDDEPGGGMDTVQKAIKYAADNGADVINLSLGLSLGDDSYGGYFKGGFDAFKEKLPEYYEFYKEALMYASDRGVTIIAAAGNEDTDNDTYSCIPADFSLEVPGMISVASVANDDSLAFYSNYGNVVSIAAPGGDQIFVDSDGSKYYNPEAGILSTVPGDQYGFLQGTSMAAPVVAGSAALMLSQNPTLTPEQVKETMLASAHNERWLEDLVDNGNYLNLENAIVNSKQSSSKPQVDDATTSAKSYADSNDFINSSFNFSTSLIDPLTGQSFNLDVDGDGKVTALGDGLMIIRKLIGPAFANDALTNNARSADATRSSDEIHQYLQEAIDNETLDVDRDGRTTALGDGLMLIRQLIGPAFAGDALTNNAMSADSPYFGQDNAADQVAANIDALKPPDI